MGLVSEAIALEYGSKQSEARQLRFAASLHDIGKCKIPTNIIEKPGKLTDAEFGIMKTHTYHGSHILKCVQGSFGVMVRNICLYHHENWDGKGYWGVYQSDLPEYVPIVSLADVFIALLSERTYKSRWALDDVLEYIHAKSGSHFSRGLVDTFLSLVGRGELLPVILTLEGG